MRGQAHAHATLRHVLTECRGTPDRDKRLRELAAALQLLRRALPAGQHDTDQARAQVEQAMLALDAEHATDQDWECLEQLV